MKRRGFLKDSIASLMFGSLGQQQQNTGGTSLVEETARVLSLVKQIQPGDLRKSLERNWRTDGGIQLRSSTRYLLKTCNNIKIDVEFRQVDVTRPFDNSDDIVTYISRPYLDYPAYD